MVDKRPFWVMMISQHKKLMLDYVITMLTRAHGERIPLQLLRVRNLKFATYLKFATCENTNKINELW